MPTSSRILRQSRQRRVVFEIVERSRSHPTAHQVFDRARRRLPSISLGTVYRNLRRLAEQGLLKENKIGNRPTRFEVFRQRHYHIWCVECGRLEDLTLPYQDALDRRVQRLVRYRLRDHQIEFYGICPDCRREPDRIARARRGSTRPAQRERAKRGSLGKG